MEILRIDGYIGADDGLSILFGAPSNFSLKQLNDYLDNVPAGTKELKVEINSGGGSVTEGFAIHDKLASSGLTIHTEVLGLCGSIATIIALSAKPENRAMHENSEYFIHNPHWIPTAPDAMEADDLQQLADDLKSSEEKILDFYSDKTGRKKNEIKPFMERSKSFSAKEAKDMGFVSNIIHENVASQKYLIAAFIDPKKTKNNTDMDFTAKQKTVLEQMFESLGNKFKAAFTPVLMMFIDLDNGTKIFIESENDELVGKKAFNVNAAGERTTDPTPDGQYNTKDMRIITVAQGVVSDVKKKEDDSVNEVTTLKAQVADLTAQLETKSKAEEKSASELVALKNSFGTIQKEFTEFKNQVLASDLPVAEQTFKGQSQAQKSANQEWLDYKKSKAQTK